MTPRTKKLIVRVCVVTLVLMPCVVAWVAYTAISAAVHGEYALHAVNLITVVVDDFVDKNGIWPTSWEDLKTVSSVNKWGMYSWPEDLEKVRLYVTVDFEADPAILAKQSVEEFDAIKPVGPYYPYKHYGYVAALIETLRKKTGGQQEHVR
jgi:hypothetical protein